MFKTGLIIGSFFSLLTVVLGAFGAHALKSHLTEYGQSIYDKAVFYQMFHGIGRLIAVKMQHLNKGLVSQILKIAIYIFMKTKLNV